MKIFAELGVRTIQIPYNPARTASIFPDLEESFATTQQIIQEEAGEKSDAKRWVRRVYGRIRAGLADQSRATTPATCGPAIEVPLE